MSLREFVLRHAAEFLLLIAVVTALILRRKRLALGLGLVALAGLIGPAISSGAGVWLLVAALAIWFILLGRLLTSGGWSRTAGIVAGVLFLIGLGWAAVPPIDASARAGLGRLATIDFIRPAWLLGLLMVPALAWRSWVPLRVLGGSRRTWVVAARCGLIAALVVALAEPRVRRAADRQTVIFVVDRSLSIPPELFTKDGSDVKDLRWQRLTKFIDESVRKRGQAHFDDSSAVIYFGARPRLVMPPASVDRMPLSDQLGVTIDPTASDISAALKLAIASFPEDSGKRIVLISDGNENLGRAEEQARVARENGIPIDCVAVAAGFRNESEVLVQKVDVPSRAARGERLPIRVLVRNASPNRPVDGTLELILSRDGRDLTIPIVPSDDVLDGSKSPALVRLRPGLTGFAFRDATAPAPGKDGDDFSFTYRAVFTPLRQVGDDGRALGEGLAGDRVQNNRAMAHVIARGQRRVLFVEEKGTADGDFDHQHLIDQLRAAQMKVVPIGVGRLPQNRADLAIFLSNYDCLVVANVPGELLSTTQQEVIRSNTYDQGCGLVWVGGPDSYGAGGYQKTPIEAALPVDCEIKALKAAGKGGLVLVMHASEMAEGNTWQKRIAKLAIERLSANDMVGVMYYGATTVTWLIPFQTVGYEKGRLLAAVDRMTPGDMPDFDPFLKAAHETLANPDYGLATRHSIIISDGDPMLGAPGLRALANMKADAVTCTTVGVATHSAAEDTKMQDMSDRAAPGGKFYNAKDPNQLPAIYIKESRRVSQSFLFTDRFNPKLRIRSGAADGLDPDLPDLFGFVRTTMKESPLAEMLVEGPTVFDQRFPILAQWQYGLGRSVAWTSDARTIPRKAEGWDRIWAGSEVYRKFWEKAVGWAMRSVESDNLTLRTEHRDGKLKLVVEARDKQGRAITDLRLDGAITPPNSGDNKSKAVVLEQRRAGFYEAEIKADEAGSYMVNVRARAAGADGGGDKVVDSVRGAMTLSYSPEFEDLEANPAFMRRIADATGGRYTEEGDESLGALAKGGTLYEPTPQSQRGASPAWFWAVFLAAMMLVADVGLRRVAVEPADVSAKASEVWDRLRAKSRAAEDDDAAMLSRLKRRKADAGGTIDRDAASRRFEAGESPAGPVATADETLRRPDAPSVPKPDAPEAEQPADYFAKLREAKKRGRRDDA